MIRAGRSERLYRGLQAVADWEAEHGALTADELAWADGALAHAETEAANGAEGQGPQA